LIGYGNDVGHNVGVTPLGRNGSGRIRFTWNTSGRLFHVKQGLKRPDGQIRPFADQRSRIISLPGPVPPAFVPWWHRR
jgi:hypothetical protein